LRRMLCASADIVPTRSHMKGPWNQAYDLDALRTMEVKAIIWGARSREDGGCRSRTTIEYWQRSCATIADGSRWASQSRCHRWSRSESETKRNAANGMALNDSIIVHVV
jgi:hypothetical protein